MIAGHVLVREDFARLREVKRLIRHHVGLDLNFTTRFFGIGARTRRSVCMSAIDLALYGTTARDICVRSKLPSAYEAQTSHDATSPQRNFRALRKLA